MALKASPEAQALLLELQALDTKLQQIAHRAKSLPEHVALQKLEADSPLLQSTLSQQKGALEDTRTELKRRQSDVEVVETRMKRDRERLQGSSSTKDVPALEQEIAALEKRQFDLEEIELTVMERAEEADAVAAATNADVEELQGKVSELEGARDASMT